MSRGHDRRRYEDGKLKTPLPEKGDLVFGRLFCWWLMLVASRHRAWQQGAKELIRQTVYEMQKSN